MILSLPVVHSPLSALHDVPTGVFCGLTIDNDELPLRASVIVDACDRAGAGIVESTQHGVEAIARVHDQRFLDVMAGIHDWWLRDGDGLPPYVTPYYFPPVAGAHGGRIDRRPATSRAEIGRYAMDTMTLIGAGTWTAAVAAVDARVDSSRPRRRRSSCRVRDLAAARPSRRSSVLRRELLPQQRRRRGGTLPRGWREPSGARRHRCTPWQRNAGHLLERSGGAVRQHSRRSRPRLVPAHRWLRR